MVSARGRTDEIVEGLDAGADDYLTKPFEVPELQARVRALLRRNQLQAAKPGEKLQVGDLSLDPNTYEVTSPESQSRLTATEFKLLHYFMSHHGQVFSHVDLLEAVWNYPGDVGDSDLVRTHIRKLRAKIGDEYIQTIHGVGYLLKAKVD
jgi:DNA-binding response OmpR family regulator